MITDEDRGEISVRDAGTAGVNVIVFCGPAMRVGVNVASTAGVTVVVCCGSAERVDVNIVVDSSPWGWQPAANSIPSTKQAKRQPVESGLRGKLCV